MRREKKLERKKRLREVENPQDKTDEGKAGN